MCITPLSSSVVARQRTKAARALGFGLAGAHPGIRLTLLSADPTTDPFFYQLLHVFLDFRRLIHKQPPLLALWTELVGSADRFRRIGPFGKILEQAELIKWTISDPPLVVDHDGFLWHLLDMPEALLRGRLLDGWHQALADDVRRRKDFDGVAGLTWPSPVSDASLNMLERARLNALREGAFFTGKHVGKYDFTKTCRCAYCGFEDSMEHRVLSCPLFATVRARHPEALRLWPRATVALREHLWPSRLPATVGLLQALYNVPEVGRQFACGSHADSYRHHDLFTDGSYKQHGAKLLSLASWAVVSATSQITLNAGPLPGVSQSICRAELYAILVALQWRDLMEVECTIWSDSAVVVTGVHQLLFGGHPDDFDTNEDLWRAVHALLQMAPPGSVQIRHVPGHAATGYIQDVDDWAGFWNQVADSAAAAAQAMRPQTFWTPWHQYSQEWQSLQHELGVFRALHLDMATVLPEATVTHDIEDDIEPDRPPPVLRIPMTEVDPIACCLPVQWKAMWQQSLHASFYGTNFVLQFVEFLAAQSEAAPAAAEFSWLELAAVLYDHLQDHPVPGTSTKGNIWVDRAQAAFAQDIVLSVASRIRFISGLVRVLDKLFSLDLIFVKRLDRSGLGAHCPLPGVVLHLSEATINGMEARIREFTMTRSIRRANDLSRPFQRV